MATLYKEDPIQNKQNNKRLVATSTTTHCNKNVLVVCSHQSCFKVIVFISAIDLQQKSLQSLATQLNASANSFLKPKRALSNKLVGLQHYAKHLLKRKKENKTRQKCNTHTHKPNSQCNFNVLSTLFYQSCVRTRHTLKRNWSDNPIAAGQNVRCT